MKKKIIVVGDPKVGEMLEFLAILLGGKVQEVMESVQAEAVKAPFDVNTYTRPDIPKLYVRVVPSHSTIGKFYRVSTDRERNLYCDCKGFTYRGVCRHVDEVRKLFPKAEEKKKEYPQVFPVEGVTIQRFASKSFPDVVYDVKVKDGGFVCSCRGFNFNGNCRHVMAVKRTAGSVSR